MAISNNMIEEIKQSARVVSESINGNINRVEIEYDDFLYLIDQAKKCEKLQQQLDAKITLINNGWEEERYVLQEKNERLKSFTKVEKVVVYDNGVSEICYKDGENMLVNHVVYSDVFLSGWEDEDCFLKKRCNREIQKKTYYVKVQGEDAFLTDVYWSVNLPNNPTFDEILNEWIRENFGDKKFEYECLTDIETNEIGDICY